MMGYIGNTRTHVYHELGCKWKPTENNKIILNTEGYKPCSFCKPDQESLKED